MLPIQRGHISAPAAMGPLWEGLAASLSEPGPGPGPGPSGPRSGLGPWSGLAWAWASWACAWAWAWGCSFWVYQSQGIPGPGSPLPESDFPREGGLAGLVQVCVPGPGAWG